MTYKHHALSLSFGLLVLVGAAGAADSYVASVSDAFSVDLITQPYVDFSQYTVESPDECDGASSYCRILKAEMNCTQDYEWEVAPFAGLYSTTLSIEDFVEYHPALPEEGVDPSNTEDVFIAQRILNFRGFNIPPTGFYGALTEQAVGALQSLKGISEMKDGKFVIGPKTASVLNAIKRRLLDDISWYPDSYIPPADTAAMTDEQRRRYNLLSDFIEHAEQRRITQRTQPLPQGAGDASAQQNNLVEGGVLNGFIEFQSQ